MKPLIAAVLALLLASCATHSSHLPAEGSLGPYAASRSHGDLVFVSGQVGARRGDDVAFTAEVESCLDRVEHELSRAGCSLDDAVSATVYLTDIDRYAAFNEVYAARLSPPYPARACVAVAALPGGARVEVSVTAARR